MDENVEMKNKERMPPPKSKYNAFQFRDNLHGWDRLIEANGVVEASKEYYLQLSVGGVDEWNVNLVPDEDEFEWISASETGTRMIIIYGYKKEEK